MEYETETKQIELKKYLTYSEQVKGDTLICNPVAFKIDFWEIEWVQNFIMS